jgi:multiple sugar transport system permease protein
MTTVTEAQTDAGAGTGARTRAKRSKFDWSQFRTYLGVAVIVIWGLAPAVWMLITSFRPVGDTFETSVWPSHPTLDNYRTAFDTSLGNHFARDLGNSLLIGVVVTIVAMAAGVFCAYALARLEFRGKYALTGMILAASMFPPVALVSPLFQLFTNLDWIGKYQALIIPDISFALPLTVYILVAFFRDMPWDLEESARIDGCTQSQAFRLIILPLAAPGLFTTAILAFIAAWNEFLLASQLSSDKTQPVTVAIANFTGSQPHQEPYTAVMAAGVIITIPLVIMVLLLQRRIVAGLTAGGVKG